MVFQDAIDQSDFPEELLRPTSVGYECMEMSDIDSIMLNSIGLSHVTSRGTENNQVLYHVSVMMHFGKYYPKTLV